MPGADDWALFGTSWSALLLAALALAIPGVLVVGRRQIFLSLGVGQATTAGIALALLLTGAAHIHDLGGSIAALLAALAASLFCWRSDDRRVAWLFAAGASTTMIVAAQRPFGMHDIQALLASGVIGAQAIDVIALTLLSLVAAVVAAVAPRSLRLLVIDPEHARACGVATRRWNLALALWTGLLLAVTVRVTGLLFAFAFLVLPPLAAAALAREARHCCWSAPLIGVAAAAAGILLGHGCDLPPAQAAVAVLAAIVPLAHLAAGSIRLLGIPWRPPSAGGRDAP